MSTLQDSSTVPLHSQGFAWVTLRHKVLNAARKTAFNHFFPHTCMRIMQNLLELCWHLLAEWQVCATLATLIVFTVLANV